MFKYIKTDDANNDFIHLASQLEKELKVRDGEDHAFYAQLNKTRDIKYAVVAYENEIPVGCGAIREYSNDTIEVKRMYVSVERRGKGIASEILKALENWAVELNYKKCLLETGRNQPEAISFYQKHNYTIIANFGRYINSENSVCFEKIVRE